MSLPVTVAPCLLCGNSNPFISTLEGLCLKCVDNIQAQGMVFALSAMVKYERERQRLTKDIGNLRAALDTTVRDLAKSNAGMERLCSGVLAAMSSVKEL